MRQLGPSALVSSGGTQDFIKRAKFCLQTLRVLGDIFHKAEEIGMVKVVWCPI